MSHFEFGSYLEWCVSCSQEFVEFGISKLPSPFFEVGFDKLDDGSFLLSGVVVLFKERLARAVGICRVCGTAAISCEAECCLTGILITSGREKLGRMKTKSVSK